MRASGVDAEKQSDRGKNFNERKKGMKKLIAVLGLLIFTAGLSACNTMRGLGQDVERGGEKVQDSATSTQKKM